MKKIFIILFSVIISINYLFGQEQKYKEINDTELKLYKDLIQTLKDTTFIVYPLIEAPISSPLLNIQELTEYDFSSKQFKEPSITETFLIKDNNYFKVICPDSINSFKNHKENNVLTSDSFLSAIKQHYGKSSVCYLSKAIFSKDKKYAVAEYFIFRGKLFGGGATVLMKKAKDKWVIIKDLISSLN